MPELMKLAHYKPMPWYYNVTHGVGRGATNRADDVRLVQYLLNRIFQGNSNYTNQKPDEDMDIDGMYGPITQKHIDVFQIRQAQVNPTEKTLHDGRVDHAIQSTGFGKISHKAYTITVLNDLFRQVTPQYFNAPASDPDIPLPLSGDMSRIRGEAVAA